MPEDHRITTFASDVRDVTSHDPRGLEKCLAARTEHWEQDEGRANTGSMFDYSCLRDSHTVLYGHLRLSILERLIHADH